VLVAAFDCTAGGVGWPQVIVAYSPQGRLIDALYLGHFGHQEHATVSGWRAVNHGVPLHWSSYEGAGFHVHRHHSRIMLNQGKLRLDPIQ
jgi:hypothetical protein